MHNKNPALRDAEPTYVDSGESRRRHPSPMQNPARETEPEKDNTRLVEPVRIEPPEEDDPLRFKKSRG